jgi:hypothetical protein
MLTKLRRILTAPKLNILDFIFGVGLGIAMVTPVSTYFVLSLLVITLLSVNW